MQAEDATTPLRQIYFVVQVMLMDPASTRDHDAAVALADRRWRCEAFETPADPSRA